MAADEAIRAGTSRIEGKITSGASRTPVAGATVLAYHLSDATIFRSQPTAPDGHFEITGLVHGYYDMAVQARAGLFVGTRVINVPPDGRAVSNFNLQPTETGERGPRYFPGSDQPAAGFARLVPKSFWLQPKGIALWSGGAAAAAALLLSGSTDDSVVASGSSP